MLSREAIRLAQKQLLARRSPADFAQVVDKHYMRPWHVDLLNDYLVRLERREITRLIINMPPRHSKSMTISQYFSSWYIGRNPDHRVILASYEADFATTWGRKARDILEEHGDTLFGIKVSPKSSAANRWDIADHTGGMITVGVGGAVTGRGADVALIDDPIKNSEEARSDVIRERSWDWWQGTMRTRFEPNSVAVIVMTRWHADDLVGRLLTKQQEQGEDQWTVLNLPAIAEQDEPPYRLQGEALWPERYDVDELNKTRIDIGNYWFVAEYQGRPAPEEGLQFKRHGIRYWSLLGNDYMLTLANKEQLLVKAPTTWSFCTVDLAASEKEQADFYVVSVYAVTPQADMIWLDMHRSHASGPEKLPILREMMAKWGCEYAAIERVGFQLDFVQNARQAGLNVLELETKGDKVARAISATVKWDAGQIYMPANASWLDVATEELLTFPNAPHDDIVDTLAYAVIEVNKRGYSAAFAYGLYTCGGCGKLYTVNEKTGWERPCPKCGARPDPEWKVQHGMPVEQT